METAVIRARIGTDSELSSVVHKVVVVPQSCKASQSSYNITIFHPTLPYHHYGSTECQVLR